MSASAAKLCSIELRASAFTPSRSRSHHSHAPVFGEQVGLEHRRIVGAERHDDAGIEHLRQGMVGRGLDGVQREVRSRADVAGDLTIDEHHHHLGIGHHADAVLDPDRTELLDGEAHFGRAAVFGRMGDPGQPVIACSNVDRCEVVGRPAVGRAAHADGDQMVGAVGEHLLHRNGAGLGRKMR